METFSCSRDRDIEEFLKSKSKAIDFEKRGKGRTYLWILFKGEEITLESGIIAGYFSEEIPLGRKDMIRLGLILSP